MIGETLGLLVGTLNEHLASRFPSASSQVVLSELVEADGSTPAAAMDRLVVTLVNVQPEPLASRNPPTMRSASGELARSTTPLMLNLDVLVSANFAENRYTEALALLSATVSYLHDNPRFTERSSPSLPNGLDHVAIEWVDLDLVDAHALWGSLGGRYLPSVLYKLRLVMAAGAPGTRTDLPRIKSTDIADI